MNKSSVKLWKLELMDLTAGGNDHTSRKHLFWANEMQYKHVIETWYWNNYIISSKLKLESTLLGSVGEMILLNIRSKSNGNII